MSKMEDMFDEMLEAQCEQMAKEKKEEEANEETKETKKATENILKQFLSYIRSIRFKNKCKITAKKHGVNYKIVKNVFIKNILQKVADVLHLAIIITAEIANYAVEFISSIINKITYFCKDVCIRITNLLTLNCGSYNVDDELENC